MSRNLKSFILALVALVATPLAMAQASRTWVSGVGDDVNPCSRTAPCKTFAGAISKTAANGIINALDPAGFGAVTITKSITIDGGEALAGILAAGTNGINVSGANITVTLRNLSIEGFQTGLVGINVTQPGVYLSVENCRIFGFNGGSAVGIRVTQPSQIVVKNTQINDNGTGVQINVATGTTKATLDEVLIQGSAVYGVETSGAGTIHGAIRRSTITNTGSTGVFVNGANAAVSVLDSMVSFSGLYAVYVTTAGARARLSGNSILNSGDALGIVANSFIESDGSNRFAGFMSSPPNSVFTNR